MSVLPNGIFKSMVEVQPFPTLAGRVAELTWQAAHWTEAIVNTRTA